MSARRILAAAVMVFSLVVSSGCTLVRIYATSGNGVHLTQAKSVSGQPFKIQQRVVFDYTSVVDVQELIREKFGSGHEFQNVSVKVKSDFVDFLLNLVTLGIAASKTLEISGDKIS